MKKGWAVVVDEERLFPGIDEYELWLIQCGDIREYHRELIGASLTGYWKVRGERRGIFKELISEMNLSAVDRTWLKIQILKSAFETAMMEANDLQPVRLLRSWIKNERGRKGIVRPARDLPLDLFCSWLRARIFHLADQLLDAMRLPAPEPPDHLLSLDVLDLPGELALAASTAPDLGDLFADEISGLEKFLYEMLSEPLSPQERDLLRVSIEMDCETLAEAAREMGIADVHGRQLAHRIRKKMREVLHSHPDLLALLRRLGWDPENL